jgi:hypothetical protein
VGDSGYPLRFILSEWRYVVDAWQIEDVTAYATVPRLGRKSRMSAGQRESGCGRSSRRRAPPWQSAGC